MKVKRLMSLAMAAVLTFSIAGCGNNDSDKNKQTENAKTETSESSNTETTGDNTITAMISAGLDPELGDPTASGTDFRLYEMVYEPLVRYGENGKIEPGLAEKWEVSEDGKEYTFNLRKDVKFSDGSNFNADSVVFSASKWDPESFSSKITGIEKVDDYTVKIKFEENCYPCIIELTYPRPYRIASQNAYDEGGKFSKMIGTGPWVIENYKSEEEVTLAQNPYYYGEKPKLDKVILKKVTDGQSRIMALQSGEADISIADIPEDSVSVIDKEKDLDTVKTEGTMGFFLMLNEKSDILKDENVRKALNYAVDKETIVSKLINGNGTAAKGLLPLTTPYVTDENSSGYAYNIEKAQELLKNSGYKDSNGDGIMEKDGKKLSLNLVFQTEEYNSWKSLCEFLQAEYAKIGVEVNLDLRESAAYYDAIWKNRDFDMLIYRTYEDSWNPHGFLRSMFAYKDETPGVCWSDATLNKYLDEVIEIQDENDRQEKYNEIFKLINDKALTIPLYYPTRSYVYNTRVKNIEFASTSYEAIKWNSVYVQ